MGFLSWVLGFGVTIAAGLILYRLAFDGTVWLIEQAVGGKLGAMAKIFLVFILMFVFIALATKVGRYARDWINDGKKVVRARPVR